MSIIYGPVSISKTFNDIMHNCVEIKIALLSGFGGWTVQVVTHPQSMAADLTI